jgi:hypothetical protein
VRGFDDTRRYVEAAGLDSGDREKLFEPDARRVYSRWGASLGAPPGAGIIVAHADRPARGASWRFGEAPFPS